MLSDLDSLAAFDKEPVAVRAVPLTLGLLVWTYSVQNTLWLQYRATGNLRKIRDVVEFVARQVRGDNMRHHLPQMLAWLSLGSWGKQPVFTETG